MFVVMSVFGGLRDFSLSFTHEMDPDLKLFPTEGKYIQVPESQFEALQASELFTGIARVVEDRVLFLFKDKQLVAYVKGVDSDYELVSPMHHNLLYGEWLHGNLNDAVVGVGISYQLSMGLFDTENAFHAYAIKPGKGAIDNPQHAFIRKYLNPVGVYTLRNDDLDGKYVYTSLALAQELLSIDSDSYTHIEFSLKPGVTEHQAKEAIQSILPTPVTLKNRMQLNDSLYRMLNTENVVVYLIVTLVVIIALFTIIGAMIMIILEKKNNMKTLSNLGMNLRQIRRVFMIQGLLISCLGGTIGVILGAVVVYFQKEYSLLMIQGDMPYPVSFSYFNLILVLCTILVLGFLASLLASSRVDAKYLK